MSLNLHEKDLLTHLYQARVLCLGDVMLDNFVFGEVDRISPEAPIPVIRVLSENMVLGGAGNVVRNLVGLGAHVHFVSVLGSDQAASHVQKLCQDLSQVTTYLLEDKRRQTTLKTRYIAHQQQLLRADQETSLPLSEALSEKLLTHVQEVMFGYDVVVLSDYAKGVLTPHVTQHVIALARNLGKIVIVDPKGYECERYVGATLLTPNKKELSQLVQHPLSTDEEIVKAAHVTINRLNLQALLVTRGAEGMTLVTRTGEVVYAKAVAREVYDVSGAGDTVVSVLAAFLALKTPLAEAVHLANLAAGIVVGKVGTAAVYVEDLQHALRQEDSAIKILTLPQLLDRLEKHRRRKDVIGFTNGCFDLLHPGHISLLQQAKASCDVLIVGLNSDASVKRLKGESRPVQTEMARATVLASLSLVDYVVIFEEDTPLVLLEAIVPNVLVKGADYTVEEIVGADIVQSTGGKVVLAALSPGFSTTNTIKNLLT